MQKMTSGQKSAISLVFLLLISSLSLVFSASNQNMNQSFLSEQESPKETILTIGQLNISGFQEGSIYTNTTLSAGNKHTCVILDNGSLKCWGQDNYGQLGDGGGNYDTNAPSTTPVNLGTNRTAVAIASGLDHSCAILDDGSVSCWGDGSYGRLGYGGGSPMSTPIQTSSLGTGRTAVAITSGNEHTCALLDNGSATCWGRNSNGQLGYGSSGANTDQSNPILTSSFGNGRTAVAISSGDHHNCAILDDGSVSCWGTNDYGQLGIGSFTEKNTPTQTSSLGPGRTAVAISSGSYHTCAILDNGAVSCWGNNGAEGRLGNGGTSVQTTPTPTSSLGVNRTATSLSSGTMHSCAILDDGSVACWGDGYRGQLGYGGNSAKRIPTLTSSLGINRTAVAISSGNYHTCAILDNASVSCWGLGDNGRLGNGGTTEHQTTPLLTSSLGLGRTAALSERDLDGDGVLNMFDSTPYPLNNPNPITELSNWVVSPSTGPSEGGTELTISGSGFSSLFGDNIGIEASEDINRTWNDYTVDSGTGIQNYTGMFTSSAIDDQGGIHIAYYDDGEGKIMYAYNYGGTSWAKCPVDYIGSGATVGISTSIQVDSEGGIHISYSGWDSHDLRYAYNISETHYNQKNWNIVTVDSTGDVGYHSSLALDSNGFVHIAYEDYSYADTWGSKLKYATNINGNATNVTGDSWQIQNTNMPSGSGLFNSIALDSEDRIYISSFIPGNNSLMLLTNISSVANPQTDNWVKYLITQNAFGNLTAGSTSIAIDSNDNIHLSYFNGSNESLMYAVSTPSFPCVNPGDCWSFETIDDRQTGGVGYFSSIAIDSKDKVHISYLDDLPNQDLKYATNENGEWEFTTIDGNTFGYNIGDYCSLSIDRNDNIHISYWDYTNNDLKYATSTIIPSTFWTNEVVDNSNEVGWWNSISTDSSGKTHVAYGDMTSGDLKYAVKENNSWTTSVVEINSFSTWHQGLLYPSMEVDSNGAVHIVYFDAGNKAFNYAKLEPNNASFSIETILSESYYTQWSGYLSLALDSNNIPHISMTIITASASNNQYKYASKHNGTWIDGTIDFCPSSCGHSYIDVDSSNRPHVTYFDYVAKSMKHAINIGSVSSQNWQKSTVDDMNVEYYGWAGSGGIVIDALDNVHICYSTQLPSINLKYATNKNGYWQNETVDEYGSVGWNVDCDINSNDEVQIVYEDKSENSIKIAKKVGSNWETFGITNTQWAGYTSIDVDSNDNVSVAYLDNFEKDLHVVFPIATSQIPTTNYSWTNIEVDSLSSGLTDMRHSSIAIDSSGNPHISYFDGQNGDLKYAKIENGTWKNYTIDSAVSNGGGDVGKYSSIGIDTNGTIHFSYFGGSNPHLKYAHRDIYGQGASYSINYDLNSVQGSHASLDIDDQNRAHIVYYDETDKDLNYVIISDYGQSWTDTVILDEPEYSEEDGTGETRVGSMKSQIKFELDSNNNPHIFFVDGAARASGGHIYGTILNGNWTFEDIGSADGTTSDSIDLAIGPNDDIHVVYMGNQGMNSVHAYLPSSSSIGQNSWVKTEFVQNEHEGIYLAVDVDSSNNTHIVHYDNFYEHNNQLIHRVYDSNFANISYSIVDSSEGRFNSLVSDSTGDLHLAYCENNVLKYGFMNFSQTSSNQINVQFGDYGNVTGTIVDDTTITVTTPSGLTGDTVNLTLWAANGSGYVLTSAFTYLPDSNPDMDGDGIDNELDDCPDSAGNSTIDQIGCPDSDGDGYSDSGDVFPSDSSEWADSDGDGVGNNGDAFPTDYNETQDSDGDGVGDNGDAFPNDANETTDSDGDGVGDNSDAFPNNGGESIDTDGDGVGDNSDEFPGDANETQDSDGDGIGDNEDEYPFLNNYNDSDGDSFFDLEDDFPNDPTQWSDYDGDGHGDNPEGNDPDLFINNVTQWSDADGDGFGDNWGNPEWNATRLFIWPGQFVEGAELADHCPTQFGNSSADGFFGCPDDDKDGIANIYDEIDNSQNQTVDLDTDLDGIIDSEDLCPDSTEGAFVDINGCLVDSDGDGIDDLQDKCPNSEVGAVINIEGCEIVEEKEEEPKSYTESLLAGEPDAILKTVGVGAVIIAVLGFLQTNFVAALLPDAVKWMQFARTKSKLSKEEEQELLYLQSLVQAYYYDYQTISEELQQLKSELTARFTNNEIKKSTREKINILISDLLEMDDIEMKRIAHDDTYFGLAGTIDIKSRNELLEEELAMRADIFDQPEPVVVASSVATAPAIPDRNIVGQINPADNYEYLEYPGGSGVWYLRNNSTGEWEKWSN